MIKRVDHAIMVVKNLEASTELFTKVMHTDPGKGVAGFIAELPKFRVAMFPFIGNGARVELIEPKMNVESRFKKWLLERGEGVMALSYFTDDLPAEMKSLKENGLDFEEEVNPDLFPDRPFRIVWVPPRDGTGIWLEFVDIHDLPEFER
jgi:hypothetical protein